MEADSLCMFHIKYLYLEGLLLTHDSDVIVELSDHSSDNSIITIYHLNSGMV